MARDGSHVAQFFRRGIVGAMSNHKVEIREYVLHRDPDTERWELRLGFGDISTRNLVARSVPGEDKDAFESICREYVRRNSIGAARNLPRRLHIQDVHGDVIDTVHYDMDSY